MTRPRRGSREERVLWMIVDLADTVSELCNREENVDRSIMAMRVSGRARIELRDKFKVNLDDLDGEARERFQAMMNEEWWKDENEKARRKYTDDLLDHIEKLFPHLMRPEGVGVGMESPFTHGPAHKVIAAALDYKSKGETQAAAVLASLLQKGHVRAGSVTSEIETSVAKQIDDYAEGLKRHVVGRSLPAILHDQLKAAGILQDFPEPPLSAA